ncbi:MAG: hypothetical protein ACJ8M1_07850 [Chthoniobacterales bacterium]
MRVIRLSGREASVVRAIGYSEAAVGSEIQDATHMDLEDVADVLNSLIAAGFIETVPYCDEVSLADLAGTTFELNPAYVHELKDAIRAR